jgi:hypothetical protein
MATAHPRCGMATAHPRFGMATAHPRCGMATAGLFVITDRHDRAAHGD